MNETKRGPVLASPERATRTKVGYVAIYRTDDYGGRVIDSEESMGLYESKSDCEIDCKDDAQFVTVATVTWEE